MERTFSHPHPDRKGCGDTWTSHATDKEWQRYLDWCKAEGRNYELAASYNWWFQHTYLKEEERQ